MTRAGVLLARVLHGRDFPIDRLAHNLRLAGEVVRAHLGGDEGEALDDVLQRAALAVSSLAAHLRAQRLKVGAADDQ